MNYFEFIEFYNLKDNDASWELFIKFRNIADVSGEHEAHRQLFMQ